ncbi:MAG: radical SAM protein [Promethearchaeota archaeon]
MQEILLLDKENNKYYLNELEVSLHNHCNLQCNECGFKIPNQIKPYIRDPIVEILKGLNIFKKNKIYIKTMVIVGGEPLLKKDILEKSVKAFKETNIVNEIEVVSNGLYPQGLTENALKYIDQFTISKYFSSNKLIHLWKAYIQKYSPQTKLNIREKTDKWDKWWGYYSVDSNTAQKMYDTCFYRRHCVTIEREKLFPCSRIAKEGNDNEGLQLSNDLTLNQIKNYLNHPKYFPSCLYCTPMMGFPKVKGGIQPDNRIEKLCKNGINFLKKKLNYNYI